MYFNVSYLSILGCVAPEVLVKKAIEVLKAKSELFMGHIDSMMISLDTNRQDDLRKQQQLDEQAMQVDSDE